MTTLQNITLTLAAAVLIAAWAGALALISCTEPGTRGHRIRIPILILTTIALGTFTALTMGWGLTLTLAIAGSLIIAGLAGIDRLSDWLDTPDDHTHTP